METLYVHNGVAYASRDLAILNGADELSLYTVEFNDTATENIEFEVTFNEVYVKDNCGNCFGIPTTKNTEYFQLDFSDLMLSKYTKKNIELEMQCFLDEYDDFLEIDDKA